MTGHYDALIVAAIALIVIAALDVAFIRTLHADRRRQKTLRDRDRAGLEAQLTALRKIARLRTFDAAATDALRLLGPVRTPLMQAYVDPTIDEPIPYAPVWTTGTAPEGGAS